MRHDGIGPPPQAFLAKLPPAVLEALNERPFVLELTWEEVAAVHASIYGELLLMETQVTLGTVALVRKALMETAVEKMVAERERVVAEELDRTGIRERLREGDDGGRVDAMMSSIPDELWVKIDKAWAQVVGGGRTMARQVLVLSREEDYLICGCGCPATGFPAHMEFKADQRLAAGR